MKKEQGYTVYILRTDRNTLYTGITNDLEKRLGRHRSGKGAKYLRGFGNFSLVYQENFSTKSEALKRECEIKSWPKAKKVTLISLVSKVSYSVRTVCS